MVLTTTVVVSVVLCIVCSFISFRLGFYFNKKKYNTTVGSAKMEAKRLIEEAIQTAEAKKKEAMLESRDEILSEKLEAEKELKERRKDIQKQERRISQKEENLDKKIAALSQKELAAEEKMATVNKRTSEIESIKQKQLEMLEKISKFSVEEAKEYLLELIDEDLTHEKAVKLANYEQQLREVAETKAREVLSVAIQRCASEQVSELAISVVDIPSEDMKGRLIGREGRNIRAIENLTGADLIIDDTPETITVSCFEPVRREIARLALEKLISDGRIHPSKIEEMVNKSKKEVDSTIRREGERAALKAGVTALHPDLIKLLGRLHYRTSYGQNVLAHSLEVSSLSALIASELGLDTSLAKRAGLLHDIGKAIDHELEGSHIELGVNLAKKYKENKAIIHAIEAHHGDVEAKTVVAFIVQAADAISAARPGSRRESLEKYLQRLENLESIAASFKGVEGCFAIQAGREVRVLVRPEDISDDQMVVLAHDISKQIENELSYPGQIKVNVIRESRVVDYAK